MIELRLLLKKRNELIGISIWDQYPQAINTNYYTQYHKVMNEKVTLEFERYFSTIDKWFSIRAFHSDNGISVYFKDITEKRNSEEKLKDQNKINETLYRIGKTLAAELDLEKVIQAVTDECTLISQAQLGFFFYNLKDTNHYYIPHTISAMTKKEFANFSMPGNTSIFAPIFNGERVIRIDDITKDPRFSDELYFKETNDCSPLKSYLAVPVISRSSEVIGALIFGHLDIAAFSEDNKVIKWFVTCTDIDEQIRSEQTQKFLAEAGSLLISSLDYETTLQNISKIAVPHFADWCAVDIIKNNQLVRLAVAHQDQDKIVTAKEFGEKYPVRLEDESGAANVIRTGNTEYIREIPEEMIESIENLEVKEYIKELSINSYICVPLKMNDISVWIITFVNEKNNRLYTEKDVQLAEDIARRASLAIDNAYLYHKTKETEENFRFFSESVPQQIWTADPTGSLNYVNQKIVEFCNLPYDQIIGQGWQNIVHPDDIPTTNKLWTNSILTGENYEVEFRLFDATEKIYKWYIGRALPLKNKNGEVLKWFGTNTDVHQLKDVKEKLAQKTLELESSNQELQNFAYIASHDLQEPLRTMSSYASLIERRNKEKLDKTTIDFLNIIINASKRMKNLIEDLLEYSQVGRQDFKDVDLNEVIKSVIFNLKATIDENNAAINYNDLPVIKAIPSQIVQLFQNLISNSIKYRSDQSPIINIKVSENYKEWKFIISDNGLGIDNKYHEKIFIIFQRLHEKGKYPGTGIGLATCKKIVEIHHGDIWLESEQGKGSKFFFTVSKYL